MENLSRTASRVLVTGASHGIGRAVARALVQSGHCVVGVSRTRPEPAGESPSELNNIGWHRLDLSNISDIEKCAATLQTMVFRAVVLCAVDYGADQRHPAANTSAREWQQVIGTNCVGHCILVSQLLQNLLSDPPGIIVNLSSDVAVLPGAGRAAYAASKAGLHALLRAIAEEHPRDQLRVYQLIPTFQLITNGIRRRRPAGFDFSSYVEPVAVAQVVDRLISSSDSPAPPGTYLVDRDGTMKHYLENTKL